MNKFSHLIIPTLFTGLVFSIGCQEKQESTSSADDEVEINQQYLDEMDRLTAVESVNEALSFIEETDDQTIEDQITLTEIPAPPFNEQERGEYFANMLEEYGADSVWTDEEGNVIGLRKGTQRDSVLAIAGHLDTVFPEDTDVTVKQRSDTLFAPGISDDGRGLATVLTLLRTIDQVDLQHQGDILFIGDVGEEGLGDLRGVKHLFRDGGPQIDFFISVDGSGRSSVTNGALGSHRYKVTFEGPGGHSWGAFGLDNPHHALARSITHFVDEADEYTQEGPKTSYNIGRIGGGTSVNSIPYESWFEVDMRSLSPESLQEIDELFHRTINEGLEEQNELRREGEAVTADFEMIGERPSGHTSSTNAIVQRAFAATQWAGEEPSLRTSSTDSNVPISKGIPAITIGGGGENGDAHSLDEWFVNEEGYKGIQRALLIMTTVAGLED